MKQITLLVLLFILTHSLFAQNEEKGLKLSLQTDLIAYTTKGGWSIWGVVQHHQDKLSLAYVNFPNRYKDYYEESSLKENDRFFRLQYARYLNPDKKMKNFYVGGNFEYHLRELEEDNSAETLNETGFKLAPIFGYEWHPWKKKDNALQNFSLALWAGPTFLLGYDKEIVFQQSGNIYEPREPVEVSVGINISYTFYKNY
jgi:hypothetical protein